MIELDGDNGKTVWPREEHFSNNCKQKAEWAFLWQANNCAWGHSQCVSVRVKFSNSICALLCLSDLGLHCVLLAGQQRALRDRERARRAPLLRNKVGATKLIFTLGRPPSQLLCAPKSSGSNFE